MRLVPFVPSRDFKMALKWHWPLSSPMKKVSRETKQAVQKRISDALTQFGRRYDFAEILGDYPEIPKSTFYRWVRQIEASGVPAANAKAAITKAVCADIAAFGSEETVINGDIEAISGRLPSEVHPGNLTGLQICEIAKRLHDCIKSADKIQKYALTSNGEVRNPKLLLLSSEHIRKTIETASKVTSQLFNFQATEQFHKAIFDRLGERDPTFVRQVLDDLTALNNSWASLGM